MSIPFLDLKAINLEQEDAIEQAMRRVLRSGWYVLGKEVEAFEQAYAAWCGTRHAIGVANGLDAIFLVLKAWGVGPGDEVIVPSNTYIATWLAASHCGATPVPVEPEAEGVAIDARVVVLSDKALKALQRAAGEAKAHKSGKVASDRDRARILRTMLLSGDAQVLESLLTGAAVSQPNYAIAVEFFAAMILGLLVIAFAPGLGPVTLVLVGASLAALLIGTSWFVYQHERLLLVDALRPFARQRLQHGRSAGDDAEGALAGQRLARKVMRVRLEREAAVRRARQVAVEVVAPRLRVDPAAAARHRAGDVERRLGAQVAERHHRLGKARHRLAHAPHLPFGRESGHGGLRPRARPAAQQHEAQHAAQDCHGISGIMNTDNV